MADRRGIDAMVRQTRIRHILVKPSEILTETQARQRAADIKARVEAGEDFGALAREFSEDIGSATEGGDLGWTSPGQMVPEFENAADSLEVGVISDPVKTQFGWHVLEVLDRRDKDMTDEMRRLCAELCAKAALDVHGGEVPASVINRTVLETPKWQAKLAGYRNQHNED